MGQCSEVFVGIDVSKMRNAIAVADGERGGEVRYLDEIDATPESMHRLVKRLAAKHTHLQFCYEAGPTDYGLYRLITDLGHSCIVVAPSLIPRKPGDRVKENRRDALALAKLLRAGELTAVWVPDEGHEAMLDLIRARAAAVESLRVHRQQVSAFMLKHGRVYPRKTGWTMRYLRWLQEQRFEHPAHQIVLQEMVVSAECSAVLPHFVWRSVPAGVTCPISGDRLPGGRHAPPYPAPRARWPDRRRRRACDRPAHRARRTPSGPDVLSHLSIVRRPQARSLRAHPRRFALAGPVRPPAPPAATFPLCEPSLPAADLQPERR